MRPTRAAAVSIVLAVFLTAAGAAQVTTPSLRRMAITIDNLPYMHLGGAASYLPNAGRGTREILRVLQAHRAPAIGFVNEGQLRGSAARIALLQQWIDAGMTLGNHTYSHPDLNQRTIEQFQREITDGEKITRRLMASREPYQRFFRHPMTHSGDTREKKEAIDRYLASRGYTIAPHTIENNDFLFNVPFVDGRDHGDAPFAARVRDLYLDYTMAATVLAEQQSIEIFGREVPQTLLIHANDLNAGSLDEMLSRFEARNYRFIPLDDAMRDPAYRTPDNYVGRDGPTWLFRWSQTLNRPVAVKNGPPMPPLPAKRPGRLEPPRQP